MSAIETLATLTQRAEKSTTSKDPKAAATKALRKAKVKNGALYYEWYVTCGVIGTCMLLYAYSLGRAWVLRRQGSKVRVAAGPVTVAPPSTPLGSAKASRIPAAAYTLFSNFAFVRVIPVYFFETSTAAEWFFTAAYTGIVIGLVFWGAYCKCA
jgi:hypothetical protein